MAESEKTLFNPIVASEKLHPSFEDLRTSPGAEPARWMLDEIYRSFEDPEGNFLEQFQTTGFDARYFELYLFAYFSRSGFTVDRTRPNPDFLVSREGITVAVEATTVNPATSGALAKFGKEVSELTDEELREYQKNELPIRFGSPLFSKFQKNYWKLDHCRDLPFVLAIEAFHDEESLVFSDSALTRYLFGLEQTGIWTQDGELEIDSTSVKQHTVGEKIIPSNFFGQAGTEYISAVMFTNSGTNAKFARMGYQHGVGCDVIDITRSGFCFNPDPDAMDPTFFSYNLNEPPLVESWGQGLVVFHNPNCLHPVPKDFFVDTVQSYIEGGSLASDCPGWHPIASKTYILYLGEIKQKLADMLPRRMPRLAIGAITKLEFRAACSFAIPDPNPIGEEQGWFSDETDSFLGVIIRDKIDNDWGFVVLARDEIFRFRAIEFECSFATRDQARLELLTKIAGLLSSPQRIFPQGDWDLIPESG